MASSNDQSITKNSDPVTDVNGRIFLVDGKQFVVGEEALNMMIKLSQFFRALITSDFKESTQKEIELKEVSSEDFENFLKVIQIACYTMKRESCTIEDTKKKLLQQIIKFVMALNKCNIGSLILLADRFMSPRAIRVIIFWLQRMHLPIIDLIHILEVAFQLNRDYLKKLSVILMQKVSRTLEYVSPPTSDVDTLRAEMQKIMLYDTVAKNAYFLNNEDRFNELPLEIRNYICEQNPSIKGFFKND